MIHMKEAKKPFTSFVLVIGLVSGRDMYKLDGLG